jgi:hypothetical protein
MSNRLKKAVALGMMTVWILLFGVCFSEEFGYFQDTPESADQTVEQSLSSPVDRIVYTSDEWPERPASVGFTSAAPLMNHSQTARLTRLSLFVSEQQNSPGKPKLFQLLSTYRI